MASRDRQHMPHLKEETLVPTFCDLVKSHFSAQSRGLCLQGTLWVAEAALIEDFAGKKNGVQ